LAKKPFDLGAYVARATRGPCFICRPVAGDPEFRHHIVYEDETAIAFLNRYPTLRHAGPPSASTNSQFRDESNAESVLAASKRRAPHAKLTPP
jgi:hypothetical protein